MGLAWLILPFGGVLFGALPAVDDLARDGRAPAPGARLEDLFFDVAVGKSGARTAHLAFAAVNPHDSPRQVTACVSLQLDGDDVAGRLIRIAGEPDRPEAPWVCSDEGQILGPPVWHVGCVPVAMPARGRSEAFHRVSQLDRESALRLVYWDLLPARAISATCDRLAGSSNIAVVAPGSGPAPPVVSGWYGGAFKLEAGSDLIIYWGPGSSVTRASPADHRVLLVARVTGLPLGSTLRLVVPDLDERGSSIERVREMPVRPGDGACSGAVMEFHEAYTVPGRLRTTRPRPRLEVALPDGDCGEVAPGHEARLVAKVFANGPSTVYEHGALIHTVRAVMVADPDPPQITRQSVTAADDGRFIVAVEASDSTTRVAAAEVLYEFHGRRAAVPLDFAESASAGHRSRFRGRFGPFPSGARVAYQVRVFDEVGNDAITPTATARMR